MTGSRGSGIGLALGVAIGIVLLDSIALGAGIGLMLWIVFGSLWEGRVRG